MKEIYFYQSPLQKPKLPFKRVFIRLLTDVVLMPAFSCPLSFSLHTNETTQTKLFYYYFTIADYTIAVVAVYILMRVQHTNGDDYYYAVNK